MASAIQRALRSQAILALTKPIALTCVPETCNLGQQPRRGSKHYTMKWRFLRFKKVKEVNLPSFVELKKKESEKKEETIDEIRMELKKQGRLPPRTYQLLPLNISCTHAVIDAYKPPDGDGKQSFLSAAKMSENVNRLMKGTKSLKHTRKLKKYEDFSESEFAEETQKIVVEAQSLLTNVYKNQDRLHELVTEKAFPEMVHGLEQKTMVWHLVETVEPARVVQIRTEEMITNDNLFAQVTVRLHTKQMNRVVFITYDGRTLLKILAIYDRFGRLMYGDPILPKSVVEYVIMEKWISDTYGRWRVHGKIIPDWMLPRDNLVKTYSVPSFDPVSPDEPAEEKKEKKKVEDDDDGDDDKRKSNPQVALA